MSKLNRTVTNVFCLLLFLALNCSSVPCFAQSDTVKKGNGKIAGRIVFESSYIPLASISAYQGNRLIAKTSSDSEGFYKFFHLQAGEYKLKAVTNFGDILITKTIIVRDTSILAAKCEEFFLAEIKPKPTYKRYSDSLLKGNIDSIVVFKKQREMFVYRANRLLKIYPICLGFCPIGAKQFEGDGKTPEGNYSISSKNNHSACHKGLYISYPNKKDVEFAKNAGKLPGGSIMIHGLTNGWGNKKEYYKNKDWTGGCIALTDYEIDDMFDHVKVKTPILLLP